jgi:hypothetical protein
VEAASIGPSGWRLTQQIRQVDADFSVHCLKRHQLTSSTVNNLLAGSLNDRDLL